MGDGLQRADAAEVRRWLETCGVYELPLVSCLCPTYRRRKLLEKSIACFPGEDFPADRWEMIIFDDAGELQSQTREGWQIISMPRR